ncbi:hypothetical protein [Bacillus badius]|uniref:Uncharacterized protein n=1 Tax=Bacillus badius TaxID=1455 RepID=A0ABR5ANT7_BACBA|nr:hypothetical protein [Bacillus badius]KIL72708.1 hypothetical protein SD77_3443 [Bacillus badius]MED4715445.1 hypothetical protein [Bacillus badius]
MDDKTAKSIDRSLKSIAASLERMSKNRPTVVCDPTINISGGPSEVKEAIRKELEKTFEQLRLTDFRQG